MKSSGIGGQAVMEGVMMKNHDKYAIAVRKPNQEIEIEIKEYTSLSNRYTVLRLPIIRGVVAFFESLVIGMKTLTYSASFYEEEDPKRKKKQAKETIKERETIKEKVTMGATVIFSILLAVGIFMVLPYFISQLLVEKITSAPVLSLIEGVIRLALFIGYVAAISMMKDIRRVFMYHGAEHKTINCIESGLDLTVANVKRQSKQHKRCGTSFLLIVMIISIIFFVFINVEQTWLRVVIRLLLVPVIAGVSYEFIRLAGRSSSAFVNVLSKPGMWLQGMTTREPEDDMIEVAIASVNAVFDWKAYLEEGREERRAERVRRKDSKQKLKKEEMAAATLEEPEEVKLEPKSEEKEKIPVDLVEPEESKKGNNIISLELIRESAATKQPHKRSKAAQVISEEEDDEILKALDKYFVSENEQEES